MKRCLTLLIIKEIKIKATMSYHLLPVRMTIIKKKKIASVDKDVEEREPLRTIGENVDWYSYDGKQYGGFSQN